MKKIVLISVLILACSIAFGQDAKVVITRVLKAQSMLRTVSYTLNRRDTLLTDDVRSMSGSVKMEVDSRDSILGFRFWAKKDGETEERIYDGHVAYMVDPPARKYILNTSKNSIINASYSGGGGHLIFPELVKLDTSKANSFKVSEDASYYYLTLTYPDYEPENLVKRTKVFTIDKKIMLPVAMKNHQEAYGKVQDLHYKIAEIKINEPYFGYDFSNLSFLANYKHEIIVQPKLSIMNLRDRPAPGFNLMSFKGEQVSSADFKGKTVLIDLWEVWCGPCIASMPKVETLYEKYKENGLLVYGITNDPRVLSAGKLMAQKKGFKLPMLIGNDKFRKDYHINNISLPMYILIDKSGKVRMLSPGFTEEIEEEIKRLLL